MMKLLVVVLCLLGERYLVHKIAHQRFHWFSNYFSATEQRIVAIYKEISPWIILILLLIPPLLITAIVLHFFSDWIFGLVGLVLNLVIFTYCIGLNNPFYPAHAKQINASSEMDISQYLSDVNQQLFAVIFWYIVLGPFAILAYRLIALSQSQKPVSHQAKVLTDILDWLPARMTAFLYLLVGNFQAGFRTFSRQFFSAPINNHTLLSTSGVQALHTEEKEEVSMGMAERLVEHAVIVLTVLLALFTIAAWM